ncbi:MAG: ABC transporter substrate-binding protein [Desulfobacterales bacterium]
MSTIKWMKNVLLYAVFSLLILIQTASADDKVAAEDYLKNNLDRVFEILQKEDLEQQAKSKAVVEIVTPMFDFALMARLSLGKKHWSGLTAEKKDRFTELFVNRLRKSYLSKLTTYTDEQIIYEPPTEVKKKIHIPTHLISKGKKISMLYKFYKSKNDWKIYDVEIQGVSIIRSYRAQFNEILQNGTFDDLLQKMQKSISN